MTLVMVISPCLDTPHQGQICVFFCIFTWPALQVLGMCHSWWARSHTSFILEQVRYCSWALTRVETDIFTQPTIKILCGRTPHIDSLFSSSLSLPSFYSSSPVRITCLITTNFQSTLKILMILIDYLYDWQRWSMITTIKEWYLRRSSQAG